MLIEAVLFLSEFSLLYGLRITHLFGGDSAEYVTVGNTWSIAHPPGYPLYGLVSNLLRISHINSWETLLSIIPTVLTSILIYRIFLLFKKDRLTALIPAVLYIFLFPIWLYSLVPEVFALNNFFIALITYIIFRANAKKKPLSPWIFFILALSFCNHQTIIFYVFGWFLLTKEKLKNLMTNKHQVFQSILLFALGAGVYLYAPIASFFHPPLDAENAQT